MRKTYRLLLCIALISGLSLDAFARGGGGGNHHATGPSSNSQALANSNGWFAPDRDKGLDRAEDRMNAKALMHEKAYRAHERRHGHVSPTVSPRSQPVPRVRTGDEAFSTGN